MGTRIMGQDTKREGRRQKPSNPHLRSDSGPWKELGKSKAGWGDEEMGKRPSPPPFLQ